MPGAKEVRFQISRIHFRRRSARPRPRTIVAPRRCSATNGESGRPIVKAAPEMVEMLPRPLETLPARSHELDKQNVSRERSIAPGCRSGRRAGGAGVRVARSFSAGALADRRARRS